MRVVRSWWDLLIVGSANVFVLTSAASPGAHWLAGVCAGTLIGECFVRQALIKILRSKEDS